MTDQPGPDEPEVLCEVADHVATLTLNRPHRRNAISGRMLAQLADALHRADRARDVRCIILTGAGKGFCAGLDIKDAMAGTGIGGGGKVDPGAGAGRTTEQRTNDLPTVILHEIDTPVIAAINGGCAGYGVDLALGCDLRIVADDARLVPGFAKRGIVPESGGTWYLPRLIGWARAAEVCFLGRDLTAARALELGLVNLVVPGDEVLTTARAWAGEIAGNAPLAVQAMKRLFRLGLSESFSAHSDHVLLQLAPLMASTDFQEGMLSWVEGRPPRFQGA
jgi:enoyl-CoA hydratase/carnithine racemase